MTLREVTYLAVVLRIFAAVIIGGILGLERGMKNRPAGLRTYMLVCVGACVIMLTNQYIYQVFGSGDPVRMGAQVVSGIGFLGAGTIIVTRRNQIKGLTTAAGLWSAAGVGLALGVGFYEAAIVGTFAVFFVMTSCRRWTISSTATAVSWRRTSNSAPSLWEISCGLCGNPVLKSAMSSGNPEKRNPTVSVPMWLP